MSKYFARKEEDESGEKEKKAARESSHAARIEIGIQVDLDNKQNQLEASQNKMQMYKNMARTYWERWRWECEKRKELIDPTECVPSIFITG